MKTFANVLLLACSGISSSCFGQASLAAENIIDDVKISASADADTYTLFRDARNASQWYYVPNKPRLTTSVDAAGKSQPEFSLIRYQFNDPANSSRLIEEGILQFGSTVSAPPGAIDVFRTAIGRRTGSKDVRISAIPFKSADVSMYTFAAPGQKSTLVANAPYGTGLAPLFASQSMVFSIPLTRIGSDVLDTLVNGPTGIPVAMTFSFNALTPPAGFKVTVNYDQLFEHYSKDEKFAASAAWWGWFGTSVHYSAQKIREELINNKDISVEIISGENFKLEDVDKYLQPILARINAELIEAVKPPSQIDPASASQPTSRGGWFGSAGYSVAIKDVKKVKKGTETWDMRVQQIVERKSIAQGFLGIGSYPEEMRRKLVTVVPGSTFTSAYLMLPSPALAEEAGIKSIDMEVALRSGDKVVDSRVVTWQPGSPQWKDIAGSEQRVLAFSLMALSSASPDLKGVRFDTKVKITSASQTIEVPSQTPAFNGQQAMPGVNAALLDVVELDASQLPFASLGSKDPGAVLQGNASITVNDKVYTRPVRPRYVDGKYLPPDPIRVIVPAGPTPTKASAYITFQLIGGRQATWKYDGQDLRTAFSGLSAAISIDDLLKK